MTRFNKVSPSYLVLAVLLFLFLTIFKNVFADTLEIQSFENESQRTLYYKLTKELRCPMCQNQNIADSNSQISIDLRNQVARLIRENKGEQEIKEYMVNRYGEFVLYKPPFEKGTLLLWLGPLVMAILGLLVFVMSVLSRRKNNINNDDDLALEEQGEN